jgi:hypothetical protein
MPSCEPSQARNRSASWLALASIFAFGTGCERSEPAGDAETADTAAVEAPRLELLRIVAWPGGGLQLTAVQRDDTGAPSPPDGQVRVRGADGPLSQAHALVSEQAGLTALWIVPSARPKEHAARLAAARALVLALPDDERVGVWLASERLPLLAELSERRAHVLERIAAIEATRAEPIEPVAQRRSAQRLMEVGGPFGPSGRNLVLVGEPASRVEPLPRRGALQVGLLTAELGERSDARSWPAAERAVWHERSSPSAAGERLAERIASVRASAFRVGVCGALSEAEALVLGSGSAQIGLRAPAALPELADAPCEPDAAARDTFPFADTVELELTPEELELHDRYDAERDESELTLSVRLGAAAAVPARAHFRGQTSLDCGRKSYSIHFQDDRARRFLPRAAANELYLLSLCKDNGWFRQVLAHRLMAKLGLFSLEQRFVRLRVAGRERGVYLLVEKPDEHLRQQRTALGTLVRRRMDANGEPAELIFPRPDRIGTAAHDLLAQYNQLIAPIDEVAPEALYAALARRLDLDNYLRWLALQTYFQCGDYVDETFFYASDESAAQDGGWYFRNLGWDTDDLFKPCHHRGDKAHRDPRGIVYCSEGALDRALFVSPDVYAHFAEALRALMQDELAPDRVAEELDQVRGELFALLQDDPVCLGSAGSIDGQPATCALLRPWLQGVMDEFMTSVRDRAGWLEGKLGEALP